MEQQPKWKFFLRGIGFCAGAMLLGVFITLGVLFVIDKSKSANTYNDTSQVIAAVAPEEDKVEIVPEDIISIDPEEYATSHMDVEDTESQHEPLFTQPIEPADIYAEEGAVVVYKCYYPEAIAYTWETYDATTNKWIEVPGDEVIAQTDELYRKISTYITTADESNSDLIVRCRVKQESEEFTTNAANLNILPVISSISVDDYTAAAGSYVSARDIPVTITDRDGNQDTVTGLNRLYFLSKEETSEQDVTVSGNVTETITTVITSCDYYYLDGETDGILRYQGNEGQMDIPIRMIGEDHNAPQIVDVHISDFEISTVDKVIPVSVGITAEDDVTAYPDLEYAFLPEGEEPQAEDWIRQASFDVDITQNGTWIAYCRDKSGNISTEEKNIIAVDNKPPIVNLSLENDTWCRENKILVNARDGLSIEYRYSCAQTGEDSGWISRNEYDVKANSTWTVMVRDAVGNVTEQEIIIDNIDTKAPVIRNIIEKQKEN